MIFLIMIIGFLWFLSRIAKTSRPNTRDESVTITPSSRIDVSYTTDEEQYLQYVTDPKRHKIVADYFEGVEKINKNASLLYQAGVTSGEPMNELIAQCRENIEQFDRWKAIAANGQDELPYTVPAFKRLAIIYDRQGKYDLELEVCKEAIARGLDMGMEARAAKCAKKLGIELNEDTISAMMK